MRTSMKMHDHPADLLIEDDVAFNANGVDRRNPYASVLIEPSRNTKFQHLGNKCESPLEREVVKPIMLNHEMYQIPVAPPMALQAPLTWVEDQYNSQKRKILDYIYPDSEPVPVCPGACVPLPQQELIPCCQPTNRSISLIGNPGSGQCDLCRSELIGTSSQIRRHPPNLLVSAIGPFIDPTKLSHQFMDCPVCAFNPISCDKQLRVMMPCCAKPTPPTPLPPRPLQRMAPNFFYSETERDRHQQFIAKVLPCLGKPKKKYKKAPYGGLVGAIEDLVIISLNLTQKFLDSAYGALNAFGFQNSMLLNRGCYCNPLCQRYPKNGVYDEPLDLPTKTSGCNLIDAFNNFMDAYVIPPSDPRSVHVIQMGKIPDTERTGNWIIDKTNQILDKIIKTENTEKPDTYKVYPHNPIQALLTNFEDKPKAKPSKLIDVNIDKAFNGLPKILYGQSSPKKDDGRYIDYVDFNLGC